MTRRNRSKSGPIGTIRVSSTPFCRPSETRPRLWIASESALSCSRASRISSSSSWIAEVLAEPADVGRPSVGRAAAARAGLDLGQPRASGDAVELARRVSEASAWAFEPRNSSSSPRAIATNRALVITSSPARFIRWSSRSLSTRIVSAIRAFFGRGRRAAGVVAVRVAAAAAAPAPVSGSAGTRRLRHGDRGLGAAASRPAGDGDRPRRHGGGLGPGAAGAGSLGARPRPPACIADLGHALDVGQGAQLVGVAVGGQDDREPRQRVDLVELLRGRVGATAPAPWRTAGSDQPGLHVGQGQAGLEDDGHRDPARLLEQLRRRRLRPGRVGRRAAGLGGWRRA